MRKFAETKKVIERSIKRSVFCEINQKEVIGEFDNNVYLEEDQIQNILESEDKQLSFESEMLMANDEYLWDLTREHVGELLSDDKVSRLAAWYYNHWYHTVETFKNDFTGWASQFMLTGLDFKSLYRFTKPHINLVPINKDLNPITFDCSGWEFGISGYPYERIEELLDFLQINPREFIKAHIGDPEDRKDMNEEHLGQLYATYPDMPERKDPVISAEKLSENIDNTTSGSNILVFTCTIDLYSFTTNRSFMSEDVFIAKGTNIWLHDSWNGSAGVEQQSDRLVKIQKGFYRFSVDGSYGYGLNDICGGLDSGVWTNSELTFEEGGEDEDK